MKGKIIAHAEMSDDRKLFVIEKSYDDCFVLTINGSLVIDYPEHLTRKQALNHFASIIGIETEEPEVKPSLKK